MPFVADLHMAVESAHYEFVRRIGVVWQERIGLAEWDCERTAVFHHTASHWDVIYGD